MKEYDIVIVGFGPAGFTAGLTCKKLYPEKKVVIVTEHDNTVVPCGMPYMCYTLDPEQNRFRFDLATHFGIDVVVDKITEIVANEHVIKGNDVYKYEKLIIATGSTTMELAIPGKEKKHIYPIYKNLEHLKWLSRDLGKSKNVVIVGAGLGGLEFADEISNYNVNVTVIDLLPDVAYYLFDKELRDEIRRNLEVKGVKFIFNSKIIAFEGDEYVRGVKLENTIMPADIVILTTGLKPNSEIARLSGLQLNEFGFIKVDAFQETSVKDIFAVGDVAEKIDFFTSKPTKSMLATIACEEARIAALNLYEKRIPKSPTLKAYSTSINKINFACVGLTEERAKELGFQYVVGNVNTFDKHPTTMPKTKEIRGKLLFNNEGFLIGTQLFGSPNVGEIINIAAYMIQKQSHIVDILNEKLATHPWLTSAPVSYPLIQGALDAFSKMKKY